MELCILLLRFTIFHASICLGDLPYPGQYRMKAFSLSISSSSWSIFGDSMVEWLLWKWELSTLDTRSHLSPRDRLTCNFSKIIQTLRISLCALIIGENWRIGHHRNLKIASQEKISFWLLGASLSQRKLPTIPPKMIPKMIWWQLLPLRGVCSNCNLSRVKFNKSCNFSIKHSEAILQFYPVERFR